MITREELCDNPQVGDWIEHHFDGDERVPGNYRWTIVTLEPFTMTMIGWHTGTVRTGEHPKIIWTEILRRNQNVVAWGRGNEVCSTDNDLPQGNGGST